MSTRPRVAGPLAVALLLLLLGLTGCTSSTSTSAATNPAASAATEPLLTATQTWSLLTSTDAGTVAGQGYTGNNTVDKFTGLVASYVAKLGDTPAIEPSSCSRTDRFLILMPEDVTATTSEITRAQALYFKEHDYLVNQYARYFDSSEEAAKFFARTKALLGKCLTFKVAQDDGSITVNQFIIDGINPSSFIVSATDLRSGKYIAAFNEEVTRVGNAIVCFNGSYDYGSSTDELHTILDTLTKSAASKAVKLGS